MIRLICLCSFFITALLPILSHAQSAGEDSLADIKKDSSSNWSFYAEADYYIIPSGSDILTLIGMTTKNIWHLEARYNYEAKNAASVFGGLNFEFGNKVKFVLTPMVGIVFGQLEALAPGLETDISYKILNFNSQTEYVLDFDGKQSNFIYTYLQLGVSFSQKFETGLTVQRTKLYETDKDLQRGIFAQCNFHKLDVTFSYFNPLSDDYFLVATLSFDF